jgi:large subunit ribosomal protein L35Ae
MLMSKVGQGVIVSCRRGPKTQKNKEYILRFLGIESVSEAAHLIGRKVAWPIGKHKALGKIVALHGKNGLVRARFRKGMPGQALGSPVEIIG